METSQKTAYFFIVAVVLAGCKSQPFSQPPNLQHPSSSEGEKVVIPETLGKALSEFNRGAALLEQYRFADAAKAFEVALNLAPDWNAARFNLGLAYFNMLEQEHAEVSVESARKAFEAVLQSEPNHLSARFCLGLYYQHISQNEKALECFRIVHQADPADLHVAYKYAETLISLDQQQQATQILEEIVAHDPGFISALYRLAMLYQRAKQPDKAKLLFSRFRQLNESELTGGSFTVLKAYGTAGKYYMALGADNLPLPMAESPIKRIIFSPEVKRLDAKTSDWKYGGSTVTIPGIAAGDVDGDGDIDLCITGLEPNGTAALWLNDGASRFSKGAALAQQGISPCFGDVDNDGDLDLWLGCAGQVTYFENDGKGNFTKSQNDLLAGPPGRLDGLVTVCARLLDLDSDGDLDFLAIRSPQVVLPPAKGLAPSVFSLYNNNRDGSFADIAEKLGLTLDKVSIIGAVCDDFDNDRDLDLVLLAAGDGGVFIWVNDRMWKYHILDAATTGLSAKGVFSATSGDPDKDGDRDLLVFSRKGPQLFINEGGMRFRLHQNFADCFGQLGGTSGQFADMDNDGDLDIVIADALRPGGGRGPALLVNDWPRDRFIDILQVDPGNLFSAITFKANASCVVADFTGDGKCDVLLAPIGQEPMLIENATPGGHWIQIDLVGTREKDGKSRSNNSAIGARVEIKTGTISQQYVVGVPSGQVAVPPYRIHAGLGNNVKVDWLRIMWPDAVLQAELEIPADQTITIAELQRKTSSCPHLFGWNGSNFEFISDFGGMGGIGYLLAPGVYSKPDPTEYLPVPNLKPLEGEYVLQILEPIEEDVYVDEVKLIAVDHPVGTEVWPNEMMAVNAPPPSFELFCFKETIEPIRTIDHRGVDVTEALSKIDRNYAGATNPDRRFTGFAEEHFVELDFGQRLKTVSPDSRLVLFLYGWVEYPYSSTNFAASQAKLRLQAPSIYALRDGVWIEIFNEVGYPGGIQHMMTLDLTGKVLPGDQRIRISSNMELYWDRIFIAPVIDSMQCHIQEVSVRSADLHFLGFPREYSPDGRLPRLYDYDSVDRAIAWKNMAGNYTRYGEVGELLESADDCYVIMGRGDELTVRFAAEAFGRVPQGCRRSFILKTDSFCKDMDLYSAYPDTVEPLPFHSMSGYPYRPDERYPDDEKQREYRRRFNTRRIGKMAD